MPSAAALRLQIETALATRIPSALTPRPRVFRDLAATGIPELDHLLEGGLPVGAISELVGPACSGRTTVALALLARMTGEGKTVAWIDTSDALDPESAAAAGVDLSRQLWVRCGRDVKTSGMAASFSAKHDVRTGAPLLAEGSRTPAPSGGCGSPHPRGESRGLSEAVDAFLHRDVFSRPAPPRDSAAPSKNRMTGTPSAPNRKLLDRTPQDPRPIPRRARDREEQVPTDRQPSRRQALFAQRQEWSNAKTLRASQVLNTADMAMSHPQAGAWTDNRNNAHGRSLATPPNAIAAGLPRFREMEARAQGQGHGLEPGPLEWKPLLTLDKKDTAPPAAPSPTTDISTGSTPAEKDNSVAARESLAGKPTSAMSKSPYWHAMDQALRATDLLLTAGGFSTIVLDLGSIPAEFAWRIPLATWFRFRAAADRARTVLLLLTQHACARSSAELVLRLSPLEPQLATTVLTGAQFRLTVDRHRFEGQSGMSGHHSAEPLQPGKLHLVPARKQPQSERSAAWHRSAAWTGTDAQKTRGDRR